MTTIDTTSAEMDEPLNDAQDRALSRVLGLGASYQSAAELLGLSKRTITRRMADSAFRHAVDMETTRRGDDVLASIVAASRSAVDLLREAIEDPAQPMPVRIRAASDLLGHLSRQQAARLPAEATVGDAREELVRMLREIVQRRLDDAEAQRTHLAP